jgi:hypothetical protein
MIIRSEEARGLVANAVGRRELHSIHINKHTHSKDTAQRKREREKGESRERRRMRLVELKAFAAAGLLRVNGQEQQ